MKEQIKKEAPQLYPVQAYEHYIGEEKDTIKSKFPIHPHISC